MPRAWRVSRHGEPTDVLRLDDKTARPALQAGEIEVRVSATSCNFADVLLCRGRYQQRPPFPFVPGLEVVGWVTTAGPGVGEEFLGSRVVGQSVLPHGGFADFAVLRAADAHFVPAGIDDATAATTHLTHLTAWLGLHRRGAVRVGDTVVITAAAGGVGSAAVQIARAAGATVIAIVSGTQKVATAEKLGADVVIDRSSTEDVVGEVRRLAPRGADVVFESVGGLSFEQATKYVGFEGKIVVVGFAGGEIPVAALDHAMVKNYTIAGLHWSLYYKHYPDLVHVAQRTIFDMLTAGLITPEFTCLPFSEVPTALQRLAAGQIRGKAVIRVSTTEPHPA
jgi:NADPH:quinone reductase